MEGHVLVVEHENRLRTAICTFLKRAGLDSHSTNTADGALAGLSRFPSLIVLDLALPDRNGMEVLRAIRETGLPMDIAIIASGWEAGLNRSMAVVRADAIFGKPFDFQDFADWLDEEFGATRAFVDTARGIPFLKLHSPHDFAPRKSCPNLC